MGAVADAVAVDQAFIQPQEHRPKPSITYAEAIPVIDLSPYLISPSDDDGVALLVSEIGDACKNWGFFQVVNHGVPLEKRRKLEDSARKFFGLSVEEKRKVKRSDTQLMGYHDGENTKNVRDWKELFEFMAPDPNEFPVSPDPLDKEVIVQHNVWPQYPPELKEAGEEFLKVMEKLAYKLMELIALSLGLPANRFEGFFSRDQTCFIKLNHYPPCPAPDLVLGAGRHTDGGGLTLLFEDDVGGLQVKRKSDGGWVSVKPTPDACIINIGDIIQVWSNEAYESVEHRVLVNSEKDRYSMPYFFNPAHYTVVEPLEELLTDGGEQRRRPPKYKSYIWGKFLNTRKQGNYKKLGVENIQISHFRIPDEEEE